MAGTTRREFLVRAACGGAGMLAASLWPTRLPGQAPGPRRNVLFIAIDDLRPDLGCYGDARVQTPSIDALASRGTLFTRAYCQQAVCSPSRTSLLTGLRPDSTRVYDLKTHFRTTVPGVVPLPEYFKRAGYHTQSVGKIYHIEDPPSWSAPHWDPDYTRTQYSGVPAWGAPDVPDGELVDGLTTERAMELLGTLSERSKPFFLAVGYRKPHLPMVAPKRYFDLYSPESIDLAPNGEPPEDVPQLAMTDWGELRKYTDIPPTGPLSDAQARQIIRAYRACTSYVDALIGRLLARLDDLGLRERTAIVLWGDHGWHLGEHALWCKHTNFETATRSPLIVSLPGQRAAGATSDALVEFVDVYPTLCDAAELPHPEHLEGTSLVPLLDEPHRRWKTAAFSQYPRDLDGRPHMGWSMRTDRYRYTEWRTFDDRPPETVAVELYDHQADPGENVNLAARPQSAELVTRLAAHLAAGWRAAVP